MFGRPWFKRKFNEYATLRQFFFVMVQLMRFYSFYVFFSERILVSQLMGLDNKIIMTIS